MRPPTEAASIFNERVLNTESHMGSILSKTSRCLKMNPGPLIKSKPATTAQIRPVPGTASKAACAALWRAMACANAPDIGALRVLGLVVMRCPNPGLDRPNQAPSASVGTAFRGQRIFPVLSLFLHPRRAGRCRASADLQARQAWRGDARGSVQPKSIAAVGCQVSWVPPFRRVPAGLCVTRV